MFVQFCSGVGFVVVLLLVVVSSAVVAVAVAICLRFCRSMCCFETQQRAFSFQGQYGTGKEIKVFSCLPRAQSIHRRYKKII